MPVKRAERVAQQLRAELAHILATETRDPRLGTLTITDVVLSGDLRIAKVYLVALGAQEVSATALEGLNRAKGFIRRELASRLTLRHVPDLMFFRDEAFARGGRIEEVLARINREKTSDNEDR